VLGEQLTLTPVTLLDGFDPPPLPPQAAMPRMLAIANHNPMLRIVTTCLL